VNNPDIRPSDTLGGFRDSKGVHRFPPIPMVPPTGRDANFIVHDNEPSESDIQPPTEADATDATEFDDWEFNRRVYGARDMTTAERVAVARRWKWGPTHRRSSLQNFGRCWFNKK
jgi:hypothetical protein